MSEPDLVAIPSQTVGPFFHFGLSETPALGCLAGPGARGQRIWLSMRVVDGDGAPVPDAMIEIWQADGDGDVPPLPAPGAAAVQPAFTGFGRLSTDADGTCEFETVRPGYVQESAAGAGTQAPHINVCLFARGLLRQIHTRIYFPDEPGLGSDPVLAATRLSVR
jgi:protocatechuate 3,4-dioxygenase alpha subunit